MTISSSKRRKWTPAPIQKGDLTYRRIWRVVDGAVADAFRMHPEYLAKSEAVARNSIVKRVTGAVMVFAEKSAKGRSGQPSA